MFSGKKILCILSIASITFNFIFLGIFLSNANSIADHSSEYALNTENPQSFPSADTCTDSDCSVSSSDSADCYDKDIYLTELSQYSDIIIPYTADKSDSYMEETLFIGDSNTAGLASFGYLPLQNVIGKKSMGIQSVTSQSFVWFKGYGQPLTITKAVGLLKPRRIIINFGTNNTVGTTATEFKSMYLKALNAINRAYPYCDIIIAAVLPVGYYRENYNITQQTVDSFNVVLAQICSEYGYRFLDYTEVFKDSSGYMTKSCVASDGIHLNDKGYRLLLEYINDHQYITKDCRPDTDNIPVRISVPQANEQQAVAAEIEGIADESDVSSNLSFDYAAEGNTDDTNNSTDNTDGNTDMSSETLSPDGTENNNVIISDSSSDLDNTNSEKTIYDPFL